MTINTSKFLHFIDIEFLEFESKRFFYGLANDEENCFYLQLSPFHEKLVNV